MQVILAGYNVDTEVLADLKKTSRPRQDVTPETLSASYARISRDPRPVNELRQAARQEVEKARKSNSAIIFRMGHHSIAEHAVFNFDILGVSRLAMEEIEKFRLCAYTEKSQRYQKLEDDFIISNEIRGARGDGRGTIDEGRGTMDEKIFTETVKKQNKLYHEMVEQGIEPEDARYATSLATQGQLGLTINARNLEFLFRRFASNPLSEIQQLGREMYKLVAEIAPSIILFTEANDFDKKTYSELRAQSTEHRTQAKKSKKEVELVDCTKDADNKLVAALLHTTANLAFKKALKQAKSMSADDKKKLVETCFQYAEFYDRPLREFEYVDLTFDLSVSAACFAQLKRHRMATITAQPYDPALGTTVPESVKKAGLEKQFNRIVKMSAKTYEQLAEKDPLAAQYVLTNAHRKRVLIKVNARELYHISRLREDKHAQWDIQNLSRQMTALAREAMPLAMMFIGGKDGYPAVFESHFGRKPRVLPEY